MLQTVKTYPYGSFILTLLTLALVAAVFMVGHGAYVTVRDRGVGVLVRDFLAVVGVFAIMPSVLRAVTLLVIWLDGVFR